MTDVNLSSNISDAPMSMLFNDALFMRELREQMFKFAQLQVRDAQLAEDAVQEAMISAYQNIEKFGRKAAFKTWVFSILKNKLIDLLRKEKRHTPASQLENGSNLNGEALVDHLFQDDGHWQKEEQPKKWDRPDYGVENDHFWRVFDACLNGLPDKYGRLFMMREFLEMDTSEICHNEEMSVSNLNVTLYRARLRLRECLEDNWYQAEVTL